MMKFIKIGIKSRLVQLVAFVLYAQYLTSPEYAPVVQDQIRNQIQNQNYELGFINFVIQVVIMMALSMAIGALTAKKPPRPRFSPPAGIEQFSAPTAEEGRSVQVLFGKKYIAGPNIVWYGDLKSEAIQVRP